MRNSKQQTVVLAMLLLFTLALTACGIVEASDEEIEALWQTSAHADAESRAFTRWDDEDPPEIPERCAKCHSTFGYRDFLGLDGATAGQVDQPVPVGSTIECDACHNEVAGPKSSAVMPSGMEITDLGQESNCMECHQGRASGVQVNETVAGKPADTVDAELSLPNVHNNPAGPTQYGAQALGGFEYAGQTYLGRYEHTSEYQTCHACHDAHTLQVKVEHCSACHRGANTVDDLPNIRTGNIDYDGDGDVTEGLSGEIETMQARLLLAMKVYTAQTDGAAHIEYDGSFVDEAGENYSTWTPRLLQAAHNYGYAAKDSGNYAHHGKYIIQLHYDSLTDLDANVGGMIRPD